MNRPLFVAIAGLGTVGAGTLKLLLQHSGLIEARAGRAIKVVAVCDRNRDLGISLDAFQWFDNPVVMAEQADVDVVVELIGGSDGPSRQLSEMAIRKSRHLVTANKAMLAHHGTELAIMAEEMNVQLSFEAAVAGGIPVLKALREGLAGNDISQVYGILNGTCNYILTTMRETGRDFTEVLAEAQALGYAEADPSFDIDGIDTAHKLSILASIAFGTKIDFARLHVEGIRHISALDIRFAEELGYRIKLLGIARKTAEGIEQRVHPCMVPVGSSIAKVENVFNAVVTEGDFAGRSVFEGRGAGAGPTASAVVSDLIDIAAGRRSQPFGIAARNLQNPCIVPVTSHLGAYYVRLMVLDRPGVFADIAASLRDEEVSMEAILQRARAPGEIVPVVLTMHDTREDSMLRAVQSIASLEAVVEAPNLLRIEQF